MPKTNKQNPKTKQNLDTNFTLFTKLDSKLIIDIHVKYKTTKFLEDTISDILDDVRNGDNFLDRTPKA